MKDRFSKILGLLMFVVIIAAILFLSSKQSNENEIQNYKAISVTGNSLLPESEYLVFTGLFDSTNLKNITLGDVKEKFESHPYITKADVEFDGVDKIQVEITERIFVAVLFNDQKLNLLSDDYLVFPMKRSTAFYELPIVSNPKQKIKNDLIDTVKSDEIRNAFKIIEAIKITNDDMYSKLAEINLQKGSDIILTFNGLRYPVIFGKSGIAKKVLCLNKIWDEIKSEDELFAGTRYLDLRFINQIIIGKKFNTEQNG